MAAKKKTATNPKGAGRNRSEIPDATKKTIENAYAVGITLDDIAAMVEISEGVIKREMSDRLKKARGALKQKLAQSIWTHAINGDATLQIFLAKTQLGWSDKKLEDNQDMVPSFRISFEK